MGETIKRAGYLVKLVTGAQQWRIKSLAVEGHQRGAAFLSESFEAAVNAGRHSSAPRMSATVKMSLSPRPHMFITMR